MRDMVAEVMRVAALFEETAHGAFLLEVADALRTEQKERNWAVIAKTAESDLADLLAQAIEESQAWEYDALVAAHRTWASWRALRGTDEEGRS